MRRTLTILCLLLAACSASEPRSPVPENINARFLDPELDAAEWRERWEVESREIFASRHAIVDTVPLAAGDSIADIGAGTGLFVPLFSEAVTDTGRVYAVDISPGFVEHIDDRIVESGLTNVEAVLSRADSAELSAGSVDVVFLCDTYHHFDYHVKMLRSIRSALRPGGYLIVVDFERIPGVSRDWVLGHVRAGKDTFSAEIEAAGFRLMEEVAIPGFHENYFLRFQKR